jgi:hypothetical protein
MLPADDGESPQPTVLTKQTRTIKINNVRVLITWDSRNNFQFRFSWHSGYHIAYFFDLRLLPILAVL